MALQGDLDTFTLPDVLRLLAGTGKTGHLDVQNDSTTGDVWIRDGQLVGGSASSSPHAHRPAEVVFELLRMSGGTFVFDDTAEPATGEHRAGVEDVIGEAEALVAEWDDVERVVPSVDRWVTLTPEIGPEGVDISQAQWSTLAAVGGGVTVRDLGERFELTDLDILKRVKDLVEGGLVDLAEDAPAGARSTSVDDHDLAVLSADDGPVVLESSADALLPEPLPDAGTSFAGDLDDLTTVDGRDGEGGPQSGETAEVAHAPDPTSAPETTFGSEPAVGTEAAFGSDPLPEPAAAAGAAPAADAGAGFPDAPPHDDAAPDDIESDEERGSLLKFLSTVKP